eukprot:20106-Pelagococcus_subviridis.AAC.1
MAAAAMVFARAVGWFIARRFAAGTGDTLLCQPFAFASAFGGGSKSNRARVADDVAPPPPPPTFIAAATLTLFDIPGSSDALRSASRTGAKLISGPVSFRSVAPASPPTAAAAAATLALPPPRALPPLAFSKISRSCARCASCCRRCCSSCCRISARMLASVVCVALGDAAYAPAPPPPPPPPDENPPTPGARIAPPKPSTCCPVDRGPPAATMTCCPCGLCRTSMTSMRCSRRNAPSVDFRARPPGLPLRALSGVYCESRTLSAVVSGLR